MNAEVVVVCDNKSHCWDVLLSIYRPGDEFEYTNALVEWPRNYKPNEGDEVIYIDGDNAIEWQGMRIPIDVRRAKVDGAGKLFFD